MLVKPHQYFGEAFKGGYAIGAFNASNLELVQAIIWAAKESGSPVIVQTSEGAIEYAGLKQMAGIIKTTADEVDVPVIMHLDHGKSLEMVKQCIEAGYTSVMIDASKVALTANIDLTSQVVEYAHDRGVWVEAELGAILGAEGAKELDGTQTPDDLLTDKDEAVEFVAETNIDALAVSVGTIHGAFTGQEFIRFELLEELERLLPTLPLVVHGASGIADEHLQRAARAHVCKVNVDTEMRIAFEDAVKAYFDDEHEKVDPRGILRPAREAVQSVVKDKMNVLGSTGKAL